MNEPNGGPNGGQGFGGGEQGERLEGSLTDGGALASDREEERSFGAGRKDERARDDAGDGVGGLGSAGASTPVDGAGGLKGDGMGASGDPGGEVSDVGVKPGRSSMDGQGGMGGGLAAEQPGYGNTPPRE